MERRRPSGAVVTLCALILALGLPAHAQYGGGSGTADDPYLIYTPKQMNAIGADPNDWDKHFQLRADIDLSQYTDTEFNLIGSTFYVDRRGPRLERAFTGTFDGDGHSISNFTYTSEDEGYIGLFRAISDPNAEIRNLGLIAPRVDADSRNVGALVAYLEVGAVTNCYVSGGTVAGMYEVGGLVGTVRDDGSGGGWARVVDCHSSCEVTGLSSVGGLVGRGGDLIENSSSTGMVAGEAMVGGLVGSGGVMVGCYADGIVQGGQSIGGLVGGSASATNCYARGVVVGTKRVGGLAGGESTITHCYAAAIVVSSIEPTGGLMAHGDERRVVDSFWDIQASQQPTSVGGTGKTTAQMQTLGTFRAWGEGDNAGIWTLDEGNDYPRLAWEGRAGLLMAPVTRADLAGSGTAEDPYLIYRAAELELIAGEWEFRDKHFKLMADIDLGNYPGLRFGDAFSGVFDGNGHAIVNFSYVYDRWDTAGFFGSVVNPSSRSRPDQAEPDPNALLAEIKNLGLINPIVDARMFHGVGALVGNLYSGTVSNCYVEGGVVLGGLEETGGLIGENHGTVTQCYATDVTVIGTSWIGGLVGSNGGEISNCYSANVVAGSHDVGGLVGGSGGRVVNCYSAGTVRGQEEVGGLVGGSRWIDVTASFFDAERAGAGMGDVELSLTTVEMTTAAPFLEAGWDFVGETENGTEDIWWIDEGQDYPRLWSESGEEPAPVVEVVELDETNFDAAIAD